MGSSRRRRNEARASRGSKITSPILEKNTCMLCLSKDDDENKYGKKYIRRDACAHYFCLLFASGLCQNGRSDTVGILGFLVPDINREIRRSARLKCLYCKKANATIGCVRPNCRACFHFGCGLENGALNQFFGNFSSYCHEHRLLQPSVPRPKSERAKVQCIICICAVDRKPGPETLYSSCCKGKNWYHRECIQRMAVTSGIHFFKCPMCNNKESFQQEMLTYGIYIPDQDAAWELEPGAYEELLERHSLCDIDPCLCPDGPDYNKVDTRWELILCDWCGSQGCHVKCGRLKSPDDEWVCDECKEIELGSSGNVATANPVTKKPKRKPYGARKRKRGSRATQGTAGSPDRKRRHRQSGSEDDSLALSPWRKEPTSFRVSATSQFKVPPHLNPKVLLGTPRQRLSLRASSGKSASRTPKRTRKIKEKATLAETQSSLVEAKSNQEHNGALSVSDLMEEKDPLPELKSNPIDTVSTKVQGYRVANLINGKFALQESQSSTETLSVSDDMERRPEKQRRITSFCDFGASDNSEKCFAGPSKIKTRAHRRKRMKPVTGNQSIMNWLKAVTPRTSETAFDEKSETSDLKLELEVSPYDSPIVDRRSERERLKRQSLCRFMPELAKHLMDDASIDDETRHEHEVKNSASNSPVLNEMDKPRPGRNTQSSKRKLWPKSRLRISGDADSGLEWFKDLSDSNNSSVSSVCGVNPSRSKLPFAGFGRDSSNSSPCIEAQSDVNGNISMKKEIYDASVKREPKKRGRPLKKKKRQVPASYDWQYILGSSPKKGRSKIKNRTNSASSQAKSDSPGRDSDRLTYQAFSDLLDCQETVTPESLLVDRKTVYKSYKEGHFKLPVNDPFFRISIETAREAEGHPSPVPSLVSPNDIPQYSPTTSEFNDDSILFPMASAIYPPIGSCSILSSMNDPESKGLQNDLIPLVEDDLNSELTNAAPSNSESMIIQHGLVPKVSAISPLIGSSSIQSPINDPESKELQYDLPLVEDDLESTYTDLRNLESKEIQHGLSFLENGPETELTKTVVSGRSDLKRSQCDFSLLEKGIETELTKTAAFTGSDLKESQCDLPLVEDDVDSESTNAALSNSESKEIQNGLTCLEKGMETELTKTAAFTGSDLKESQCDLPLVEDYVDTESTDTALSDSESKEIQNGLSFPEKGMETDLTETAAVTGSDLKESQCDLPLVEDDVDTESTDTALSDSESKEIQNGLSFPVDEMETELTKTTVVVGSRLKGNQCDLPLVDLSDSESKEIENDLSFPENGMETEFTKSVVYSGLELKGRQCELPFAEGNAGIDSIQVAVTSTDCKESYKCDLLFPENDVESDGECSNASTVGYVSEPSSIPKEPLVELECQFDAVVGEPGLNQQNISDVGDNILHTLNDTEGGEGNPDNLVDDDKRDNIELYNSGDQNIEHRHASKDFRANFDNNKLEPVPTETQISPNLDASSKSLQVSPPDEDTEIVSELHADKTNRDFDSASSINTIPLAYNAPETSSAEGSVCSDNLINFRSQGLGKDLDSPLALIHGKIENEALRTVKETDSTENVELDFPKGLVDLDLTVTQTPQLVCNTTPKKTKAAQCDVDEISQSKLAAPPVQPSTSTSKIMKSDRAKPETNSNPVRHSKKKNTIQSRPKDCVKCKNCGLWKKSKKGQK